MLTKSICNRFTLLSHCKNIPSLYELKLVIFTDTRVSSTGNLNGITSKTFLGNPNAHQHGYFSPRSIAEAAFCGNKILRYQSYGDIVLGEDMLRFNMVGDAAIRRKDPLRLTELPIRTEMRACSF